MVSELRFGVLLSLMGRPCCSCFSIMVKGGSSFCKFGWSKFPRPSGRSATFLEFGNIKIPMYTRLRHYTRVRHFFSTIFSRMQVKGRTQPIVLSIPFAIMMFFKRADAAETFPFESLYTVREIMEHLCYVAYDYDSELSKDTQPSYEVSREGVCTLSKERFQTGEILFQPWIAGLRAMGLHQAIALCMDHCFDAELTEDNSWFKTVVLTIAERLEKELKEIIPLSISNGIRVIPPPYGADSAWFGPKLIANLSTFPGSWCMTKKQFRSKS